LVALPDERAGQPSAGSTRPRVRSALEAERIAIIVVCVSAVVILLFRRHHDTSE
jgi:hypothetical protein